jgi:hypothetical protein
VEVDGGFDGVANYGLKRDIVAVSSSIVYREKAGDNPAQHHRINDHDIA